MIDQVKNIIVEVKDFPKPGIGFKDITPLIESPEAFNFVVDSLVDDNDGQYSAIFSVVNVNGFDILVPEGYLADGGTDFPDVPRPGGTLSPTVPTLRRILSRSAACVPMPGVSD